MPTPLPILADTYRCALQWSDTATGQTAVNVIHLHANASGTHAATAMNALDSTVAAFMWALSVSTASISEVAITPLDGTSATSFFTPATPSHWQGGQAGGFIPQAAAVVKLPTGVRGRANRGRVFLPFLAESLQDHGRITSSTVALAQTAWTAFVGSLIALSPTSWNLVVASYDRAHLGAGAHITPVTGPIVELETGTQRRRQGRNR